MTAASSRGLSDRWRAFAATHPQPGEGSVQAGRAALELADRVSREGHLLVLCLSGGASAMLAVPAAGLTLADKAATTACCSAPGFDIGALNSVRRHLSAIKGGQLGARAGQKRHARHLRRLHAGRRRPARHRIGADRRRHEHLCRGPGAHRRRGPGRQDSTRGLPASAGRRAWGGARAGATRRLAACAARPTGSSRRARTRCARPKIPRASSAITSTWSRRPSSAKRARRRPVCSNGRARSRVRRASSRPARRPCACSATAAGGRNQELALAALEGLTTLGEDAVLASLGTDGVDGPTDAAGAFVDRAMWQALGAGRRDDRRTGAGRQRRLSAARAARARSSGPDRAARTSVTSRSSSSAETPCIPNTKCCD